MSVQINTLFEGIVKGAARANMPFATQIEIRVRKTDRSQVHTLSPGLVSSIIPD